MVLRRLWGGGEYERIILGGVLAGGGLGKYWSATGLYLSLDYD